jgi:hypothetical protein
MRKLGAFSMPLLALCLVTIIACSGLRNNYYYPLVGLIIVFTFGLALKLLRKH